MTEAKDFPKTQMDSHSQENEALEFAKTHEGKDWLFRSLRVQYRLDGIVSEMRHVEGGQIFVLEKLQEMKPDLVWYRGGTITTWKDRISNRMRQVLGFSEDDLETLVIDGGANGVLGRPEVALGYVALTKRDEAVLYTVKVDALIDGLKKEAISLVSEHNYDLRIISGRDNAAYLEFCRKNLNVNSAMDEKELAEKYPGQSS